MRNKILFTIITVCYNSDEYIRDAIDSILNQTYTNIEYIIVDGNSTDKTVNIIKEYESKFNNRMKWISESDKGIYDAMNKGVEMATGDIIVILNSDDFYSSNGAIERIVKKFEGDPSIGGCYCDVAFIDRKNKERLNRIWHMPNNGFFSSFKFGWHPFHASFFVKKHIYEEYGVYDLNLPIAADIDLMCRFIEKEKINIEYIPEILIKVRAGGVSNEGIGAIIKGNRETFYALKKNSVFPYLVFSKPLRKLYQVFRAKI